MITVRIEHPIKSYDTWKMAFDHDPVDRKGSGVLRYRVLRPVDDPAFVMIDLDFQTTDEASNFLAAMQRVWASAAAAPALGGTPKVAVVQEVETAILREVRATAITSGAVD
jgi:hypothetical protein